MRKIVSVAMNSTASDTTINRCIWIPPVNAIN
jgi:hypothetical protein